MMIGQLITEVVEERMGGERGWMETSQAELCVVADALWLREEQRLEAARTDAARIIVDGEPYRRMPQPSSRLYHGRWGAHRIEEPLYRREGVRNGPTLRPLDRVIGVVDGSLLPELALALGSLCAVQTSREVEETLTRLGFRPPSRATIQKRTDGLFDDMATTVRELEQEVRVEEKLDFELGAVSCGLDRFAVAMDEELPDGPERDAKLVARQKRAYERTPPEPYEQNWRMAWAGNVTLYDTEGVARRSLRYGTDAGDESHRLAARMTDDILHLVDERRDIPVAIIQDGAAELAVLPQAVRERLPEGVPRWQLVDFHHAIGYLDAIVTARDDGDPYDMRRAYRGWLLNDDDGAQRVVRHLRHEAAKPDLEPALAETIDAALTYFERRRPLMKYKAARDEGLPIASGTTESTCGLYQLRVKHPGSHWRPPGLRGVMTARGLMLSGRFDAAFEAHYATLLAEVRVA
ncbi:hypothetical protein G6O69_01060 [Pseudenhygromyxa sp. WMMC2535]|uniref:hypothetical protein n=1 Tax=Pseudenhygromyxa sp. WMMC2535 TaxID=2712867 RepID=UPI0015954CAE|nr:hypothetical protein [Pseudenhygromyxa sp. WMMC2535]NVB36400.1 hypothetical protein [Pseudenhygromyxa sp. WMMC2535]